MYSHMTQMPFPLLFTSLRPEVGCSKVPRAAGETQQTTSVYMPICCHGDEKRDSFELIVIQLKCIMYIIIIICVFDSEVHLF